LGTIGVQYEKYEKLIGTLKEAEKISTKDYLVKAKWSKILSGGKRSYSKCYAIPFMLQLSGAGIVTPCGFFFHDRYKDKFHMGNIAEKSFKEIWQSDRYWQIIDYLTSDKFNAHSDCGTLCLQHKVNEYLWELKNGNIKLTENAGEPPMHINFI
ncbi:MAG TPA: SPASM domain-containing protein, partial [Candidatus Wallbacteria bacterium]|nr:SPASM domain-containing protein [Candidatus Wallbacteria bacterium]